MPLFVKVNHAPVSSLGCCTVTVPSYKGADPLAGDQAFIWTCETAGGEGLAMRGQVESVLKHGRRIELRIRVTDQAPRRPFNLDAVWPYRNGGDSPVLVRLASKIIRHALAKVAKIDHEEVHFLNGFFEEADDRCPV